MTAQEATADNLIAAARPTITATKENIPTINPRWKPLITANTSRMINSMSRTIDKKFDPGFNARDQQIKCGKKAIISLKVLSPARKWLYHPPFQQVLWLQRPLPYPYRQVSLLRLMR